MTRFWITLDEAVDLVLFAFEHGEAGDILVQKAPACTIQTQAEAVCELFGGNKEDIKIESKELPKDMQAINPTQFTYNDIKK